MSSSIKKLKVQEKLQIDLEMYVNEQTGETLVSELQGGKMIISVTAEGDYVVITSDDFVILDAKTADYLSTRLNKAEMANVLKMTTDLKTPLNLIYNGVFPHTNESLQKYLGYTSKAMFLNMLRNLMKEGVIYQLKGKIQGQVRVTYLMNPFFARKRKTIKKELVEIFSPFSKEEPLTIK